MDLFSNVLFQEGALEIIKEQQQAGKIQYKYISKKVALGLLAKSDLYEIEATASAQALEVLKAENQLNAAKLALLQEMNLSDPEITLVPELRSSEMDSSYTHSANHIFQLSLQVLPSLQISALQVEAARKNLAVSKSAFFPTISLSGSIGTSYSDNFNNALGETVPFSDQITNNQNKSIGLSLSFPIFGNGRVWNEVKIARISLEKARTQLTINQQKTFKIIQELTQKSEALLAEKQLNEKKLLAKNQAYLIAIKKFEKELTTHYDLQIAENSYLSTKIEQVRLNIQIAIQNRYLDYYSGSFILPTIMSSN